MQMQANVDENARKRKTYLVVVKDRVSVPSTRRWGLFPVCHLLSLKTPLLWGQSPNGLFPASGQQSIGYVFQDSCSEGLRGGTFPKRPSTQVLTTESWGAAPLPAASSGPVSCRQAVTQDCPGGKAERPRPGHRRLYTLARQADFHDKKPLKSSSEGFGDGGLGGQTPVPGPGSCLGVKDRGKVRGGSTKALRLLPFQAQLHGTSPHRHQEQEGGHADRFFQLKFL